LQFFFFLALIFALEISLGVLITLEKDISYRKKVSDGVEDAVVNKYRNSSTSAAANTFDLIQQEVVINR